MGAKCEAAAPKCQWYGENGGKGKCAFAKKQKRDGCYERFGADEAKCEAAAPKCQWYGEKGGRGRCAFAKKEERQDRCYERFGTDEAKCEAAAPKCQWYGEKGGRGRCALADVENSAGIAMASTARDESPQVNSNKEDEVEPGSFLSSAPVITAACITAGLAIIAGAACFVRHHREQKKRELRLASNAEKPPLEVNDVELARV